MTCVKMLEIEYTNDDTHTRGVYKGKLLKKYPVPLANAVQTQLHASLRVTPFGDCCGIKILQGFEEWGGINADSSESNVVEITVEELVYNIQYIKQKLDKLLSCKGEEWNGNIGKPYVLVVLTEHQMLSGIGQVLKDYFGFQKLENDFVNLGYRCVSKRLCIMGLCLSEFHSEDLF